MDALFNVLRSPRAEAADDIFVSSRLSATTSKIEEWSDSLKDASPLPEKQMQVEDITELKADMEQLAAARASLQEINAKKEYLLKVLKEHKHKVSTAHAVLKTSEVVQTMFRVLVCITQCVRMLLYCIADIVFRLFRHRTLR